jgi:hypothetical protein
MFSHIFSQQAQTVAIIEEDILWRKTFPFSREKKKLNLDQKISHADIPMDRMSRVWQPL